MKQEIFKKSNSFLDKEISLEFSVMIKTIVVTIMIYIVFYALINEHVLELFAIFTLFIMVPLWIVAFMAYGKTKNE